MITLPTKHFLALVGGVLFAVLSIVAGVSWLREHDSRIVAEQTIKASQERVQTLEQKAADAEKAGQAQIDILKQQAARVRTAPQAIQAIPVITDAPLNARAIPDMPNAVAVDAVPLYEALNACRVQSVQLGVCGTKLETETAVVAEKDVQIKALKNKGGFWHRLKTTAKDVGIGIAIGYGLHIATGH